MSLLVLNSASRIAQSLIKNIHKSNQFEKIVCADQYPNFQSIQAYLDMKQQLSDSKTKISDAKFEDKQDLTNLITSSSHILHITHDYYSFVSPKQNILQSSSEISNSLKIKNFISIEPIELLHQSDDQNFPELQKINPDYSQIKTDILFNNGSFLSILSQLSNLENNNQLVHPLNILDLYNYILPHLIKSNGLNKTVMGKDGLSLQNIISKTQKIDGQQKISQFSFYKEQAILQQLFQQSNYQKFVKNYKELNGEKIGEGGFLQFFDKNQEPQQRQYSFFENLLY